MSLQRPSIRHGAQVLFGIVLLLLLAWPILASPLQQNCATMAFNPPTTSAAPGDVVVLRAGRKYELLGRVDLKEKTMATPAVADGVMYLRTLSHLMALEGKP